MLMDLSGLGYHTILGTRPDIFLHAVPAEAGSNQVGCRTNARMTADVEDVENLFTEGGWHNWARVTGLRIADQITGAVENG